MQRIRKVFAKVVAGLLVVSNLAIVAPSMTYAASASSFTTYGGWNEMMYATIKGVKDADVTAVSYSGPVSGSLTGEDFEYLVRDTADVARVDVMELSQVHILLMLLLRQVHIPSQELRLMHRIDRDMRITIILMV